MTIDVEAIQAGRETDILIAERVTGTSRLEARVDPVNRDGEPQFHWGYPVGHDFAPPYSTDITAALQLVDKWVADHAHLHQPFILRRIEGVWMAQFHRSGNTWFVEYGYTREMAICRAYLLATEPL